ncbi:MAG TPA: hypothetical protein VFF52_02210 [Isosphaeraceae bacterium]|nr:hypothetical protein [Isosphaeraceae bacterium]
MAKWTSGETMTPGKGNPFKLRVRTGTDVSPEMTNQITTTVSAARIAVEWTVGKLSALNALEPYTKACLTRAFNTPAGGPDQATFELIKTKYVKIQNGIADADLAVKVGPLNDANGSVAFYPNPGPNKLPALEWDTDTSSWAPGGYGQIKIDFDYLKKRSHETKFYRPVKTFIHEASHRFASTADFYYYTEKSGWEAEDGPAFQGTPDLEWLKDNADSYGWFAVWLYYFATV